MGIFCCVMMRENATLKCDHHDSAFDCPDVLIHRCDDGRHGIIVHDGGSSFIVIAHCPWCGTKLPDDGEDVGYPMIDMGHEVEITPEEVAARLEAALQQASKTKSKP